jgi:hypothetical protein
MAPTLGDGTRTDPIPPVLSAIHWPPYRIRDHDHGIVYS